MKTYGEAFVDALIALARAGVRLNTLVVPRNTYIQLGYELGAYKPFENDWRVPLTPVQVAGAAQFVAVRLPPWIDLAGPQGMVRIWSEEEE